MPIFNNGKYKSILAATSGELAEIAQTVQKDKNFRPHFHIAPPTGLMNDPNGLIFDGEKYHLFYQWFPFDALHGMKHWKHLITKDFQHYQSADDLIPCELFESHGCYSGGAIIWQEQIVAFYTGNTRNAENQRIPHQNMAIFSKEGKLLSKRCLLNQAPKGYTEHVRDPKPFITAEGKIRFVLGAQREDLSGTALLYEMDDLNAEPHLLGELNIPAFDNRQVFMWECPDLFKLDGKDVFIWSPQGKSREPHQFQNNYHAVYAVGKLDGLTFHAEHIAELDQGFDFYAPQTFSGLENKTYAVLFGWIGLPDLTYPTDKFKWHSALTLPRELRLEGNKIHQCPIAKTYENLTALSTLQLDGKAEIADLDRAYIKFESNNQAFDLTFFQNEQGQSLRLSYKNGLVCLDRSQSEQTALMEKFGSKRFCEIENLQIVEIFFDYSVVEIFLNHGEKAMTSRFFIESRKNVVESNQKLTLQIGYPKAIQYR